MKNKIKEAALDMINEVGLINLSRSELCKRVDIPDGSWPHVMGCTFSEFIQELKNVIPELTVSDLQQVNRNRADPALRKNQILNVALTLSIKKGYHKITREDIAKEAGVSPGLVSRYFNTMVQLRRAIIRAAINQNIPEIIAQGIANGDENAKKAPSELKRKAIELITNF